MKNVMNVVVKNLPGAAIGAAVMVVAGWAISKTDFGAESHELLVKEHDERKTKKAAKKAARAEKRTKAEPIIDIAQHMN